MIQPAAPAEPCCVRDGSPSGTRRWALDSGSTRSATARPRASGDTPTKSAPLKRYWTFPMRARKRAQRRHRGSVASRESTRTLLGCCIASACAPISGGAVGLVSHTDDSGDATCRHLMHQLAAVLLTRDLACTELDQDQTCRRRWKDSVGQSFARKSQTSWQCAHHNFTPDFKPITDAFLLCAVAPRAGCTADAG